MLSNTNQSKPTTSLFSNLGNRSTSTKSQPQTGGLFSNLNTNTSQAQAQPSMFTHLNTSTSQTQSQPSLFSNLGGAPVSQPTSNPFSGLGSSQQQPASGTGGLFGASTTGNSQAPATNLFASQNNSTTQPFQSSLFASPAPQQQLSQATQAQQPIAQQSNGVTGTPQPAYFDSLLERGRKRTNGGEAIGGSGELPSLQLGLGDISRRVRELGGTGGQAKQSRGQDAKT